MNKYFGTDGIRGIANKELTTDIAYRCGLALTKIKHCPLVVVGEDTRLSNNLIMFSLSAGIMAGGGNVVDAGIIPTSAVSYLTSVIKADFGVMISASHNPKEYNGIKIFASNAQKASEELEGLIEEKMMDKSILDFENIGTYVKKENLKEKYLEKLIESVNVRFNGLKVVLDFSNGASYKIGEIPFKKLGAEVIKINYCKNNNSINENCGSLFVEGLKREVLNSGADCGFAFDGDADRIIAVDETGRVIDGDAIIFILAMSLKKQNKLKKDIVVGTTQTNSSIEKRLNKKGIRFLRSDVGDKYVIEKMRDFGAVLGGEQSGHIIQSYIIPTGDGILAALKLLEVMKLENKKLSELFNIKLMPQLNTNIKVKDKMRVKNSEEINKYILNAQKTFNGRIVVRASGTEEKIRIMVEGENKTMCKKIMADLVSIVNNINI